MSKLPQKPGIGGGKTTGTTKGTAGAGGNVKGNDPKHLPR